MSVIGKTATEVERPQVPLGIVHQRRALFASQHGPKTVSFTTPEVLPSTSAMTSRVEFSETRQNHVKIEVSRIHAPPELLRKTVDEEISHVERRVVLMRQRDPEPSINIREAHFDSTPRHERGLRRYPVVSVSVCDPPEQKQRVNTNWQALPPRSIYRNSFPAAVHRNYSSSPSGLNLIKAIEGVDSVAVDFKPPKEAMHMPESAEIQVDDDEVESEIAAREIELEKAKETINRLSMDLARLEKDKEALDGSITVEEDLDIEELVANNEESVDRDTKVKLDAETILRECNRMMEKLKEEEEADAKLLEKIQRGESSGEEVEREILRLQRQVSELNAMGVELPSLSAKQGSHRGREDTSQILSLKDQAVMFSSGSTARQDALISRLERELTDAQTCNHRLNAQLGSLANNNDSTLKKEYIDLKKALKDRNDELDQLRKKVQKFEKDRTQWEAQKKQLESKLPVDVQQLLAQKKELTHQLDREQTEKHELFMQMNSYIAQLADAGDAEAYKKEADRLKREKTELQGKYELLEQDLSRARDEVTVVKRSFDGERRKLTAEAEDARKELNMKAAALQSLMLAKQDNGKIEQLSEENKRMAASVDELQTSLRDAQLQMAQQLSNKLEQMSTNSTNAAQSELQRRLDETEERLKALQQRSDTAEEDKKQLQQSLNAKTKELSALSEQLRSAQQENEISSAKHNAALVQLQAELAEVRRGGDDDTRRLQESEKVLKTTVDETCAKLDATRVALLAAESRAVQAEADLKAIDVQMKNAERRAQQLQAQLNATGDGEKEMELLRDELKKAEERHNLLLTRHQKAEAAVQENANIHKRQMDELQQRLERAERDSREVMEKQNASAQQASSLELIRQQADQERSQAAEVIKKLEKELETARNEKQGQKFAVAEEITTLTNMTQTLRNENSTFQEQINSLERDLHHLKEELEEKEFENEQLIKELEQARAMADTERQTMSLLKSSQAVGEEEAFKVKQELAHEKEERRKAEETLRKELEQAKAMAETERQTLTLLKSSHASGEEEVVKVKEELVHEKEARKKAEADLIAKFGAQLEEISKERTNLREAKSHVENELEEVRKKLITLEEEHAASKSRTMEEETKLRAEASKLQTTFVMLEDGKKELEEQLKQANHAKEEMEKTLEKKIREAKEETESAKRETESQRARVSELEAERTRELGSNDEEKRRLLEELRFYREKADSQQLEVATLKTKISSSSAEVTSHQAKVDQLQAQLENLQVEYEEMKQVLHSSQESVEKMRDSEQMAAKIKKQLEEIELEHKEKIHAEQTKREEVERRLDELQAQKTQTDLLLQSSNDSQKEELLAAQQKVTDLEAKLATASKAQSELLMNVKNLTSLVESESKRIEDTAAEKRKWQAKAEELERNSKNVEDSEEMRHLVAENARMAGELLQLRSKHAENDQSSLKELQERLMEMEQEKHRIMGELQGAKSRSEEVNRSMIQADKKRRDEVQAVQRELDRERQERERLQERIDSMYSNGHSNGPQRTLSNMSAVTSMTNVDYTEIDDVDQLHALLDKKQRIITVLRRKLLKLQN